MIKVENLRNTSGAISLLSNINTTINKGDVIAIVGPSKKTNSSFLRCLNLLEEPTNGKILFHEQNILDKAVDLPKIRQKIGMIFQSPNLFENLTVLENLTIGQRKALKKTKMEAETKAIQLLNKIGLLAKKDTYPAQMSSGQQQRVAIARCLAMEPDIILFDHPTSSCDAKMSSEVFSLIRILAKEGMTMLIATDEIDFAREISNRCFYFDDGTIYEEGTTEQIFMQPQKEKTRVFAHNFTNFNYHIENPTFDLFDINASVELFANKHSLSNATLQNIFIIIEKCLQNIPLDQGADIRIIFSEVLQETTINIEIPDTTDSFSSNTQQLCDFSQLELGDIAESFEKKLDNKVLFCYKMKNRL